MAKPKKGLNFKDVHNISSRLNRNKIEFDDESREPGRRKNRSKRSNNKKFRKSANSAILDIFKRGVKRKALERKKLRKLKKQRGKHNINRNVTTTSYGNSQHLNYTTNIDLRKLAQLAAQRRDRERIEAIKNPKKAIIKQRTKKERWDNERKDNVTGRLVASGGEFVLMDGFDYEGYYHIQDDGVAYTEPTFVQGKSQVLVPKEKYIENKSAYDLLAHKLEVKNPYNTVKIGPPKKATKKVTKGLVK